MGNNIVSLDRIRAERQYREFHSNNHTVINLALDTVYTRPAKRDIAKELTQGYIKLLSKQH